jgi:arsenate reductase
MRHVLFLCTRNMGRGPMAEAFFNRIAEERGVDADAESAGLQPAAELNPLVVEAMRELGFDLSDRHPRAAAADKVRSAWLLVTLGCQPGPSDLPGIVLKDVDDWGRIDLSESSLDEVRAARDRIRERVIDLVELMRDPASETLHRHTLVDGQGDTSGLQ